MMRQKFLMLLMFTVFSIVITSCTKEDEFSTSVENFTTASLERLNESCKSGEAGCYELVFPVTIQFSDSTTVTVNSTDELRSAITTWKENNDGERPKPQFVFPISVINEAGEVITVSTTEELKALVRLCRGTFGGHGRPGKGGGRPGKGGHGTEPCFTINFPLTISFPVGTTATVAGKSELKTAVRTWKEANPEVTGRPEIVFPISVTLEDGTNTIVSSKEELRTLKESCRG